MDLEGFAARVDAALAAGGMTAHRWHGPLPPEQVGPRRGARARAADAPEDGVLTRWIDEGHSCNPDRPDVASTARRRTPDGTADAFEALDAVLDGLCPDLTYRAFREFRRSVLSGTSRECGHYGDVTVRQWRFVSLVELHAFLDGRGLLGEPSCARPS